MLPWIQKPPVALLIQVVDRNLDFLRPTLQANREEWCKCMLCSWSRDETGKLLLLEKTHPGHDNFDFTNFMLDDLLLWHFGTAISPWQTRATGSLTVSSMKKQWTKVWGHFLACFHLAAICNKQLGIIFAAQRYFFKHLSNTFLKSKGK